MTAKKCSIVVRRDFLDSLLFFSTKLRKETGKNWEL